MALSSIQRFNQDLDFFKDRVLPHEFARVMKLVAVDLFVRLVKNTPVDTGRARAGWQLSVGQAIQDENATFTPGESEKDGGNRESNGAAAANEAINLMQQNLLVVDAAIQKGLSTLTDTKIFIHNPVVYIGRLDAGHSKQAPQGFTDLALGETSERFF